MIQLDPWLQGHMLSFDGKCDPDHVSRFRSFPVMPDRFLVSTQRNRCVETKKRQRQKAPADFSVGADESSALGGLVSLDYNSADTCLESYEQTTLHFSEACGRKGR